MLYGPDKSSPNLTIHVYFKHTLDGQTFTNHSVVLNFSYSNIKGRKEALLSRRLMYRFQSKEHGLYYQLRLKGI